MAYTPSTAKSPYGYTQVHAEGSNSYVHNGGENLYLRLPIAATNADGDVLFTVPANLNIWIRAAFWEVTTAFTGGSSSAIGVSSSLSPHDAAGDIHGGAAGDVLATLTVGFKRGTQGLSFTAAPNTVVLTAGATIKFNRVTSAFTAGDGYLHLDCVVCGS